MAIQRVLLFVIHFWPYRAIHWTAFRQRLSQTSTLLWYHCGFPHSGSTVGSRKDRQVGFPQCSSITYWVPHSGSTVGPRHDRHHCGMSSRIALAQILGSHSLDPLSVPTLKGTIGGSRTALTPLLVSHYPDPLSIPTLKGTTEGSRTALTLLLGSHILDPA